MYLDKFRVVKHSGYLNIEKTVGKTFKPYYDFENNVGEDGSRRLWRVVLDGLKLFDIEEKHVTNIGGIRLAILEMLYLN